MTPHQRFRQGNAVVSIAVRIDKTTGEPYSRITDIQKFFPNASLFNVNGVFLNYLEDEYEQIYEPARITHYPNHTIDIVATEPVPIPISPPVTLSGAPLSETNSGHSNLTRPMGLSTNSIDLSVSNLSLRPLPSATSSALVHTPLQAFPPSLSPSPSPSSSVVTLQATSIARSMAMLSTIALDITQLQQQLELSANQQSVYHQQQMHQLINMVAQQNEMVRQQNLMLQEQAASKEREEKMLQEQAESKIREEQMLKMQQETIDRLIVNQQRVDALLVQNYELHEYPIPRLFVVLPESFSDWDPRTFLMERFRLFFLCECGNSCGSGIPQVPSSDKRGTANAASTTPIPVRNSIHLANHEGYELSRPTEFFDQYGPYVLGMLRILQHCLAVATVAAPVAALADGSLNDVMDGVKSISQSTMQAVDMSINILETKLGANDTTDALAGAVSNGQDDDNMFENLAALEGADLRRLDTFLRNNDQNKILGNIYRITTEQGHVKWVCFEHYKETYRHTALASFVQVVETGGGSYDPHLGHVTISLKSGTMSKDILRRLATQAPAVESLDVTLDWDFKSTDLTTLVDMVAKSNVKVLKLDLQDDYASNATIASLRPGKGRYHSLLGLLSNTNLRSLQFSNLYLLGTRTSNLPSGFSASWLQSFCFYGRIKVEDQSRLSNIISHCSQLVDLRVVSEGWRYMGLSLQKTVFSLKMLRRLHLSGWYLGLDLDCIVNEPQPMKEIVYYTALEDSDLTKIMRQSGPVLEVLVLCSYDETVVDIGPEDPTPIPLLGCEGALAEPLFDSPRFSALTHLDLSVPLAHPSLQYLSTILPRLDLVHFGCNIYSLELLQYCNIASLKSLSIMNANCANLELLLDTMGDGTAAPTWDRLEQLYIGGMTSDTSVPTHFLQSAQLTRLYLDQFGRTPLAAAFEAVNLSRLQEIYIYYGTYCPDVEQALAKRIDEFTESLVVRLDKHSSIRYLAQGGKPRTVVGSSKALPRHRVTNLGNMLPEDHHFRFLQHILPVYSF